MKCHREGSGTACPSNTHFDATIGNLKVKRSDNDNWVDWSSPWGHCVDYDDGARGEWGNGSNTAANVGFNIGDPNSFTACPNF